MWRDWVYIPGVDNAPETTVKRRRRKPKSPLSLWIVENREAQPSEDGKGWTSDQLAERLHLAGSTIRGWESGRSLGDEYIRAMERLFGKQAPGHEAAADQSDLAAAIRLQATAIEALTTEIRIAALAVLMGQEGTSELVGALVLAAREGKLDELVSGLRTGDRR